MRDPRTRFDYFSEAPVPKGAEGWERMYPYYLVPGAGTRKADDARFWFANTIHFSRGCHPFDSIGVEGVYLGVGLYSSRVFAIPVALGLDVRVVNGFVYQSPTPVKDPDEIARRAAHFSERAGFYYENWESLYARWKEKMLASLATIKGLDFQPLPELDPIEVVTEGRGRSTAWNVIENYQKLINEYFLVWQYHFEFLNLGYGAYITLFEFCKQAFPQITDQVVARMVAGVDSLAFRPDDELRRLAKLGHDAALTDTIAGQRGHEAVFTALAKSSKGRQWREQFEQSRHPWFDYSAEYGFRHDQGTWNTNPSIPLQAIGRYAERIADGEEIARPVAQLREERDALVGEYRSLLNAEEVAQFDALIALAHKVYPYIEEHNIYVEHWALSAFWEKAWELGDFLLAQGFTSARDDIFYLNRFEVDLVLADVVQSWAIGVPPKGEERWRTEIADRRKIIEILQDQVPPPAYGTPPDEVTDPFAIMNFGITTERVKAWLGQADADAALSGVPASKGTVEGLVRVLRSEKDLPQLKYGEIAVAAITAPSWAPAFSVAKGVITDTGGMMCHAAIVCREYGIPAVVGTGYATARLKTGQRVRVDGNTGEIVLLHPTSVEA